MDRAFYLGRIDEVPSEADVVTATLWEWPSGRELSAALGVDDYFAGQAPREGQRVRIWTWMEYPGEGQKIPRVEVETDKAMGDDG